MPIRESSQSPRPPVNGAARARPARNGVHSIRNGTPRREAAASIARRLFGTDGVRGVANVHPMTAEMALQLGRALAYVVRNGTHRHRIVIGKDTRLSGYMLEQAIASGICSMGVDVMLSGPLPTPGIAFLTQSMRADAGVVISASHNPYQDNGIKFFSRDGFKLPDARGAADRAARARRDRPRGVPRAAPDRDAHRQGEADRRRDRPLRRVPQVASSRRTSRSTGSPSSSTAPTAPRTTWRPRCSRSSARRSSRST